MRASLTTSENIKKSVSVMDLLENVIQLPFQLGLRSVAFENHPERTSILPDFTEFFQSICDQNVISL